MIDREVLNVSHKTLGKTQKCAPNKTDPLNVPSVEIWRVYLQKPTNAIPKLSFLRHPAAYIA